MGRRQLRALKIVALAAMVVVTAQPLTLGTGVAAAQSGGGDCPNGVNGQECNAHVDIPGLTIPLGELDVPGGGNGDGCDYAPYAEYWPGVELPRGDESPEAVPYLRVCPEDDFGMSDGVVVWFEPGEEPAPGPTAAEVLDALWAEVQTRLRLPEVTLQPTEAERSVINIPTFATITNPQPATRYTGSADGIEVWIDVWPAATLNPGEPDAPAVPCDDDGTTFDLGGAAPAAQAEGGCAHTYRHRSAAGWTGNVTITWTVTWDSSVAGQQGALAATPSTTAFGRIVDEVAAVVTDQRG